MSFFGLLKLRHFQSCVPTDSKAAFVNSTRAHPDCVRKDVAKWSYSTSTWTSRPSVASSHQMVFSCYFQVLLFLLVACYYFYQFCRHIWQKQQRELIWYLIQVLFCVGYHLLFSSHPHLVLHPLSEVQYYSGLEFLEQQGGLKQRAWMVHERCHKAALPDE